MGEGAPKALRSVDEYLAGELVSEIRHEYVGGEVYAMVGASDRHGLIALNLATALRPHLRGTPCQLFLTDMKLRVRVAGDTAFYYPDLLLSQDRVEAELRRRVGDGWEVQRITEGAVSLTCVELEVPLATIYEDVPLPGSGTTDG